MAGQVEFARDPTDDNARGSNRSWKHDEEPALHTQSWEQFHSPQNEAHQFPIDALHSVGGSVEGGPTTQGCLPERIRINSTPILRVLRKICGIRFPEGEPVMIFRPYKALLLHESAIRDWATNLKQDMEETPAADPTMSTTGTSQDSSKEHHSSKKADLNQMNFLILLLDKISARLSYIQSSECNAITFSDLYLLYRPGDVVISRDYRQAYRVLQVESERTIVSRNQKLIVEDGPTTVHCICIDFDGERLGPVLRKVVAQPWGLTKEIQSLEILPLERAIMQRKVSAADLHGRGATFVKVAGVSPMHYTGRTLNSNTEVNGTVIIDFQEAFRYSKEFDESSEKTKKNWKPSLEDNLAHARLFAPGFDECEAQVQTCFSQGEIIYDDSYVDVTRAQNFIRNQMILAKSESRKPSLTLCAQLLSETGPLTEDELIIMNHRVFGFVLDFLAWAELDVSHAVPVEDVSSLEYSDLVVPPHIKEILRNVTSHHLNLEHRCSIEIGANGPGFIDRQDEGLVILLYGAPGVGKKTTVDCIARMAAVPLLRLPIDPVLTWQFDDYEQWLEKHFALAERWNAIVMIDQADAILHGQVDYNQGFIWDRSNQTGCRRAMTRISDTFNGITFLIADRRPFDSPRGLTLPLDSSARDILSRINASFFYPPLDRAGTVKIFELNMRRVNDVFSKQHQTSSRPACLTIEEDILSFASAFYEQRHPQDRWNCREIQKAFRTALALAHADAEPLPQGQSEFGSLEPWKITLKATHFEAVARSTIQIMTKIPPQQYPMHHPLLPPGQVPPPPMPPPQMPPPPMPQQQMPMQQVPPLQQNPQPQTASRPRVSKRHIFPPEYSRDLEVKTQLHAPIVPSTEGPDWVPTDTGQRMLSMVRQGPQGIFLASPLSLEARPELRFMEWEAFKDARAHKGSDCSAIDVLQGEPEVSFDQEAQDSVWWSRWGNRNRAVSSKAKDDANAPTVQKEKAAIGTHSSPLPERIRIHSKYIAAILGDIRGSRMSKTSFVMVRPFRALVYYEEKIRAKHGELVINFKTPHDNAGGEELAGQPQSAEQANTSGGKLQSDDPVVVANERSSLRDKDETANDNASVSSARSSSSSHDGEVVDTSSATALEHLECLVDFLDMIKARVKFLSNGNFTKVTFADVWFLYTPGQEVIDQDRRQAYRILSVNSSGHRTLPPWKAWKEGNSQDTDLREPSVMLHCVHILFDGRMLGSRRRTFGIASFEGEQDITSLPFLPLQMVKDPDSDATDSNVCFRQKLMERGKMFVEMTRSTPMHYNGPLMYPKEEVDSQVVVDIDQCFAHWSRDADFKRPVVVGLIGKLIGREIAVPPCEASCCAGEQVHNDAYAEQKRNETYIGSLIPDPQDHTKKPSIAISPRAVSDKAFKDHELSDEDLVIMSYAVCGFVLRTRIWALMDLKYLTPLNSGASIRSNGGASNDANEKEENALDQLVLPRGHKDVVKSLISQHFQDKASRRYAAEEKDLVRGKGKGLIILLHGSPGVGKTTTAEGVAQAFNRPLFQITCGDLGTNAKELEDALEWHFYLANKWNCILLLDEADVFLSARSPEDFQRNSLVAVFLRVLEYYAGVLFLTTNRIGDFDEAFSSRIHISLYYPPLTRSSTKKIFDLNLRLIQQRIEERGVEIQVEHRAIVSWAVEYWKTHKKMRWNGRQIRNACQTALALAEYDAQNRPKNTLQDMTPQGKSDQEKPASPVQLTIGHLETVAKAYMQFMRYLHEVYGKDSERRAKAMGIRAREFSMKNWMKTWSEDQETQPQEEEEEEQDESDEDLTGPKAALQKEAAAQQTSDQVVDKNAQQSPAPGPPEVLEPGFQRQQPLPTAMGQFPLPPFLMPQMQGGGVPFANPFGQPQPSQPASYQQALEQQRQYLVNLSAYGLMPGSQPISFPGVGMPAPPPGDSHPQGGMQPPGTAHILPGGSMPRPG